MNKCRFSFVLLLTAPFWAVACTENGPAENPEQPTATAEATGETTPPPETTTAPVTTSAPTTTTAPTAAPAPKPAKERIVGKWQFSFEGEPKAKAEEELKKKFAKEKDTTKLDAEMKKLEAAAAGEWIEFVDGTYVSHVTEKEKDKVVAKMKYEVTKEEGNKLSMKGAGKDEITKKEMKDEITITFVDDNTISMPDPKKKMTLIFKRK